MYIYIYIYMYRHSERDQECCMFATFVNSSFCAKEVQMLASLKATSVRLLWILQWVPEKMWLAPKGLALASVNQHILKAMERKMAL